jgi:hypothetical protein
MEPYTPFLHFLKSQIEIFLAGGKRGMAEALSKIRSIGFGLSNKTTSTSPSEG